jgi:deoxyuridine 5'-triphosphate nucleotidohydrolase
MLEYTAPWALKKKPGDAGYDIYAANQDQTIVLYPGVVHHVQTGLHLVVPEGHMGKIEERSGYPYKRVPFKVMAGVIDHGYTGEVILFLINVGNETIVLDPKNALAQIVIVPIAEPEPVRLTVKEFAVAINQREFWRNDKGFGSTDEKQLDWAALV